MRRSERLLRAAAAACASTGVAVAMHVAGGGAMPHAPGVLVPLALAFAVALQLAGVAMSRWRLATAVLAAQLAFHGMFLFGSGGTLSASGGGAHASHDPAALVLDASGLAPVHHHTMSPSMLGAHLVAAIVTYVLLRRADVLLAWGARVVATLWARLALAPSPVAARTHVHSRPTRTHVARPRIASSPRVLRGPPLALT